MGSRFIPRHQGCICFEEESCHSRKTTREQKEPSCWAVPRAQIFCLSYGYTYHKCLTVCSHDADCCKRLFTLGFTEAAWARRMNALELTSSLPHLPLPTNTPVGCWLRTKGQESAEELALLQLLFLVQNEVSGLFFVCFSRGKRQDNGKVKRAAREVLWQCVKGKYTQHSGNGG